MGYRSDIQYAIRVPNAQQLVGEFLDEYPQYKAELLEQAGDFTIGHQRIDFSAESVKWYSERPEDYFPEVEVHEALWEFAQKCRGAGADLRGMWAYIGDDDDDYENRSFGEPFDGPVAVVSAYITTNNDYEESELNV